MSADFGSDKIDRPRAVDVLTWRSRGEWVEVHGQRSALPANQISEASLDSRTMTKVRARRSCRHCRLWP